MGSQPANPGERDRLLDRLAGAPGRIAEAARSAAAAELLQPPRPGEWSAREVVGHLVEAERTVFHARLDQLAAVRSPRWEWVEPGVPDDPSLATMDDVLATFSQVRAQTLGRVDALDDTGWRRSGVHATLGILDVAGLLAVVADHDDEHHAALVAAISSDPPAARTTSPTDPEL